MPDLYCSSVASVPFGKMAQRGIVNICFDLDNTLAERTSWDLDENSLLAVNDARRNGYIKNICIVSNIIFGAKRAERVYAAAEQLKTKHCFAARFWERKPGPRPFMEAMRMMNSEPCSTAIIGDQIFTDIAGGKKLGLYTILVKPLGGDHWATMLTGRRFREALILQDLKVDSHLELEGAKML